jgi:hypothetical protein
VANEVESFLHNESVPRLSRGREDSELDQSRESSLSAEAVF